jgi:hypothetical protein
LQIGKIEQVVVAPKPRKRQRAEPLTQPTVPEPVLATAEQPVLVRA